MVSFRDEIGEVYLYIKSFLLLTSFLYWSQLHSYLDDMKSDYFSMFRNDL